jgi:SAM-dependent methyltransferase
MIRLLCRALPVERRAGMTAIDVGCGNGRNSVALAAMGFDRVIGIDPSAELVRQCEHAARQAGRTIEGRVGALPELPCEPAEADVAIAWGVMYVLGVARQVGDALDALARTLKPGGLLICDWRGDGDHLLQYADRRLDERTVVLNDRAPLKLAGAAYSFWSEEAVRSAHERAGFEVIDLQREEIRETRPRRAWRWWQTCARRGGG